MILYNPTVSGSLLVTGSLTTTGTITSQTLVVQTITSSIEFNTGSTRNGTLSTNTHEFTGSVSITGSAAALLNVNNGVLFVSSSGNVGIGTSSPGLNLSVQGLYGQPTTSGVQTVGIFRAQDSSSNIALDMGVIQYLGSWIQSINKANSAVLTLALNPNGGNVGIGTVSPDVRLHISGSDGIKIQATGNSDTPSLTIINNTNQYGWARFSGGLQGNGKGYAAISCWNASTIGEVVRISGDGNVGIGTTSPSAKLDVIGSALFSTSIQSPAMYGRYFTPTSISGATAYIDTGIALENNAIYLLTVTANPAAAGGVYSYNEVGLININSQYNGSTNTQLIKFTRLSISNASVYPGNLTLSVVFLIGGSEVTQTSSYLPSGQIRIKIDGFYNAAGTNFAYLTRIG
jgi:hypothetical protein